MKTETHFNKQILIATEEFVKKEFAHDASGHDWWHIYRVKKLALAIAKKEKGNLFLVEMAALLHDLDDWKLSEENGGKTEKWLKKQKLPERTVQQITSIINEVSFKGNGVADQTSSLEAMIVQDADRIDAIGAIGIARAFSYGGSRNRMIYNPEEKPAQFDTFEEYKVNKGNTINHFYEKLLLLKNRMKTNTGEKIAKDRHRFMETFLTHFFNEWDGII